MSMKIGVLHSDMACVLYRHVRIGKARQLCNSGKISLWPDDTQLRLLRHGSSISACLKAQQTQQIVSRQGRFHPVLFTNRLPCSACPRSCRRDLLAAMALMVSVATPAAWAQTPAAEEAKYETMDPLKGKFWQTTFLQVMLCFEVVISPCCKVEHCVALLSRQHAANCAGKQQVKLFRYDIHWFMKACDGFLTFMQLSPDMKASACTCTGSFADAEALHFLVKPNCFACRQGFWHARPNFLDSAMTEAIFFSISMPSFR